MAVENRRSGTEGNWTTERPRVVRSENKCHERLPSADFGAQLRAGCERFRVFGLNTAKRLNTAKPPPSLKRTTEKDREALLTVNSRIAHHFGPMFVHLSQFAGECRLRYVKGGLYRGNGTNPESFDDPERAFIGTLERG
jgi:hypothetical protein